MMLQHSRGIRKSAVKSLRRKSVRGGHKDSEQQYPTCHGKPIEPWQGRKSSTTAGGCLFAPLLSVPWKRESRWNPPKADLVIPPLAG